MSYAEFKASTISIHALRVEGDYVLNATDKTIIEFLSTPSGWRATSSVFYYLI